MAIEMIPTGPATAIIPVPHRTPIRVFGTEKVRAGFDEKTLQQAVNARLAPGVENAVLTPDAHIGFGAPIGCALTSKTHIYPGPVGVDVNCSMSLLQFDLPEDAIVDKPTRRALINAISARVPTGYGRSGAPKKPSFPLEIIERALSEGATPDICREFNVPVEWSTRCEDPVRVGADGAVESLAARLDLLKDAMKTSRVPIKHYTAKLQQLGSYGGGNHFGECEIVRIVESEKKTYGGKVADAFGLKDGCVAFLSHCGSRGFGNALATRQFKLLKERFELWGTPIPSDDPLLVYAPLGTPEANDYIADMNLSANFATLNHLVINSLVLAAFQEVFPGINGSLVYYVSHNIARREIFDGKPTWVHRKGSTRAYPANHFAIADTPFATVGHPILLPGNPTQGSSVMVALEGAKESFYTINHGAGRAVSRRNAFSSLDQDAVDRELADSDVLTNCRKYPLDEAPAAYKDFNETIASVELAGLAREVARLRAKFVIKDSSAPDD